MDKENPQDETTVLLDHHGRLPASGPLTDAVAPPLIKQLEERMIYAACQPRSRIFIASLNPLVAAASGLLAQVVLLKQGRDRAELNTLKQELSLELKQFEALALRGGVEESQLVAARYVLCTVLDETVVASSWGHGSGWSQISLLSSFHNETFGGEKVFQLIDRLSKDPVKHLHMLELLYLCLSLGFEGMYRIKSRGALELEGIRDALYRSIRQVRGDISQQFSPRLESFVGVRHRPVRIVPAWAVTIFTLVFLGAMYSGFAWVLEEQRANILQLYQLPEPVIVQPLP
ncbi:DotU family type IV/VI secretion system protein [Pseudomonas sp. SWRI92]|uniref:DotU family type IV/VI secretion system protein n=1 Tax=Pseudomonas marvdashtae TaxID=2745500 RepID=A0A923JRU2_9PSED|nr:MULTISPECIES: type IVB secretion system protein IcmH/DotU [Pseudomonas]MBC3372998.1 DotU family type IV/VI secretion system protein [Pseudomonas sp. SWRI92]MBV4554075.1 type IVB secretion system protein IcmH/DotU [Pseudomonas marvdashtae]